MLNAVLVADGYYIQAGPKRSLMVHGLEGDSVLLEEDAAARLW